MAFSVDGLSNHRVAIVTGGSRGIGGATAHRLARLGYSVVVNYVHDQQTADSTVKAILDAHGSAVAVRADASDAIDVDRLFTLTIEAFGAVDAVVHTVRGRLALAPVAEIALDDLDRMVRATSRAAFLINREAARHLRNGGAIVNLTGFVGASASPGHGAYATATAAVEELSRMLALELRHRDITVNALSLDVDQPCAPDLVADVIAHLLGGTGRGITGQAIHISPPTMKPSKRPD
jgi:3-oxoacyl-[acyl-carrier protein] reductase